MSSQLCLAKTASKSLKTTAPRTLMDLSVESLWEWKKTPLANKFVLQSALKILILIIQKANVSAYQVLI
jgi:hypothetical protein